MYIYNIQKNIPNIIKKKYSYNLHTVLAGVYSYLLLSFAHYFAISKHLSWS